MTRSRSAGKKAKKPKRVKRSRGNPVTIFISDDEKAEMLRKCIARGCTQSDLFRSVLKTPQPKAPKAPPSAAQPEEDPRQVTVTQHLEATA